MSDALPEDQTELPASLKFLKILVTILTGVMILGVVVIIFLLVTRLTQSPASIALPDQITLPDGATAAAFTRGSGWFAVVTTSEDGETIVIYDLASGTIRQEIAID
ncbi:MAG: DUF6476 family protein [Halocynthiibacter sp.]